MSNRMRPLTHGELSALKTIAVSTSINDASKKLNKAPSWVRDRVHNGGMKISLAAYDAGIDDEDEMNFYSVTFWKGRPKTVARFTEAYVAAYDAAAKVFIETFKGKVQ